jgi:hypothetical protein
MGLLMRAVLASAAAMAVGGSVGWVIGSSRPAPAPQGSTAATLPADGDRPMGDVEVTECGIDPERRWARARVTVTNDSPQAWDYTIRVGFRSADGATRLATGYTYLRGLDPDRTREVEVLGGEARGRITCRVAGVERTAPQ